MAREQLKNLTEPMYYILLALQRENHGYGIMQEIEELTGGRAIVGAGTLYTLLGRFEKEEIIEQVAEEERRKTYIITEKGRQLLDEEIQRLRLLLADEDTKIVVDPAMADNGALYTCLPADFPAEMKKLCRRATVITPNVTEALLLLGRDGHAVPQSKAEYEELIRALAKDIDTSVVLTSVSLEAGAIDCAVCEGDTVTFISEPYVAHGYHGTGDVFSSVLTAAYLRGRSLVEATSIAAEFVRRTIRKTDKNNPNLWYGVNFEAELPSLAALLAD